MEIAEKIHLAFEELNSERLLLVATTCLEMVNPVRLELAFCKKDKQKLKIIELKQKEAQEKLREFTIKAQYAVGLYYQHLDIELKKQFRGQPFNIPLILDETSIFRVEIVRFPDEEEFNEMDHVECALVNALKVCQESIVWSSFYSELQEMEQEIKEQISLDKQNEPGKNGSMVKQLGEGITIGKTNGTVVPANEQFIPPKFLQIFKDRGAELFNYFQSEYTLDDHTPVAKYSYLFHFLAYHQLIIARSQSKYMEFIKETFGVNMSKILPENGKFTDDIHPLLSRLKSDFERKSKSELN